MLYFLFNLATVLYIYKSLQSFFHLHPMYSVPFSIFTILLSIAFGVAATLFVVKVREIRLKSAGFGLTGILLGGLAAGCPGCYFGLFPIFLSLFGISATLAILPFNGLELQILGTVALGFSILTLAKESDVACEVPKKKK